MSALMKSYADSLAGSTPAEAKAIQDEAHYVSLLLKHDWRYEWSSDHDNYLRGLDEKRELRGIQLRIDPDFRLWNLHCPSEFIKPRRTTA